MSREPFIVKPSRKPGFWAEIDRLNRADEKAARKATPEPTSEPKKSPSKKPKRAR